MRGLIESGYEGYFTFESDSFFRAGTRAGNGGPLARLPLSIKKASLSMLHLIGKEILSAYDVYEEE
jgi:hypothetical protein